MFIVSAAGNNRLHADMSVHIVAKRNLFIIIIIIIHSFIHIIVFQVDLSSILRVIYDYSVMSEVTRAYPLLVWGVTLGLLPSCKVGGTHQPGRAGMQ